jgi:hypothetical protein
LPLSSLGTRSPYCTGTTGGDSDGLERLLSHRPLTSDDYVNRGQTAVNTWMDAIYTMWALTEYVTNIHEQTHLELNEFEHCDNCSHDHCRGRIFTVLVVTPASRSVVVHPASERKPHICAGNTRPSGIQPAIRTALITIGLFYAPLSSSDIYYWLLARWPVSSMYTDYRLDPVPPATVMFTSTVIS